MSSETIWDAGLQPERTHLAWRRTALSVAVGALVTMRILPTTMGDIWWIVPGILGVLAAAGIWFVGERRYRAFVRQLDEDGVTDPIPAGGGGILAMSGFVVLVGVVALATVLWRL